MASRQNELKNHPSPYLAMHGNDPVHWQKWSKKVFEQAKKENKLVFLSIGYFSCHWCHVMQKESYKNPQIAAFLNRNFIAVKVDRELQPALDARLIEFVERTRGYAGWPLNVFITPEGYPLLGIVYLPPADFKELLGNISAAWADDRKGMAEMAKSAAVDLQKKDPSTGNIIDPKQVKYYQELYLKQALQMADHLQGGFGESSKFPLVPQLVLLLDLYKKNRDESLGDFLLLTLDKMASQGLYDHLRGGFFRYVVDPNWLTPHFEKMLYDNAQLARLYLDAARVFKKSAYKKVALNTLDFMLREFSIGKDGMISSLSAIDNKGVEGGFYLWSNDELKKILSSREYKLLQSHWGLYGVPSLDAGHHARIANDIPAVAKEFELPVDKVERIIGSAKKKLLAFQHSRSLPRDVKVLASWNGLALSALVSAISVNKSYETHAREIKNLILKKFWDGQSLKRAVSGGKYLGDATLEDYAYVAEGLLAWANYTGKTEDYKLVNDIIQQAWKRFYNGDGWILSEDLIPGLVVREGIIADGPMPSSSASLIRASLEISKILNDKKLFVLAKSALNRGNAILKTDNFWYATHIMAMSEALQK